MQIMEKGFSVREYNKIVKEIKKVSDNYLKTREMGFEPISWPTRATYVNPAFVHGNGLDGNRTLSVRFINVTRRTETDVHS